MCQISGAPGWIANEGVMSSRGLPSALGFEDPVVVVVVAEQVIRSVEYTPNKCVPRKDTSKRTTSKKLP
jgi:hypothetical protein